MMKFDEQIEQHFPTTVLRRYYKESSVLNKGLISLLDKLASGSPNAAELDSNTTQGGFQSHDDTPLFSMQDNAISQLKSQVIWPAVESYLTQVLDADPFFTPITIHGWAVSLDQGDWQAPHMHPKEYTLISGVYYVDVPSVPAPEGCLEFINPNLASVAIGGQDASRRYHPRTGEVILFPPYYMHYVHPLRTSARRSVIAFDVKLDA